MWFADITLFAVFHRSFRALLVFNACTLGRGSWPARLSALHLMVKIVGLVDPNSCYVKLRLQNSLGGKRAKLMQIVYRASLTNHFVDHPCLICVHKAHVWNWIIAVLTFHLRQGEVNSLVYKYAFLPCHILAILIASPDLKKKPKLT